jgi:ABC-2 type transport system permease protein
MLIAAFSKSVGQASGIAMMLILSMSMVGGAWFPTSLMPSSIQMFAKCSIVYWSISGFMDVLWRGSTFVQILPTLGMLAMFATAVIGVSLWKFSKSQVL